MKRGYFITGTDTGVGKTYVASAIARQGVAHGQKVFAFKPVESGGTEDQQLLVKAAGSWQSGDLAGVYALARPVAPFVAAQEERCAIDLDRIQQVFQQGAAQADLVVVEGAGGWRVPLTADADMSTLAKRLRLPIVIVGRATLGTINHTLLTLEAVDRDGCKIAAVVLSCRPEDRRDFAESNREQIARRWNGRIEIYGDGDVLEGFV